MRMTFACCDVHRHRGYVEVQTFWPSAEARLRSGLCGRNLEPHRARSISWFKLSTRGDSRKALPEG